MRWLGYLFDVAINCLYMAIILAVFDQIHHRPEAVIVAILGLLYVTIRMIGIGLSLHQQQIALLVTKHFVRIRTLLGDPEAESEAAHLLEYRKAAEKKWPSTYINFTFLGITSIICLLTLWSELWP